jgi:hypothetical protein
MDGVFSPPPPPLRPPPSLPTHGKKKAPDHKNHVRSFHEAILRKGRFTCLARPYRSMYWGGNWSPAPVMVHNFNFELRNPRHKAVLLGEGT